MTRALFALLALCGCTRAAPPQRFEPVPGRPYEVRVAEKHEVKAPAPVLFLLHAYGTSVATQESYFRFGDQLKKRGWILVMPTGTRDADGQPFWNATEGCCDRFGTGVDDLAYLDRVYDELARNFALDPRRVFALGMSNGGFFAHRLACDRSERFTAVVSITGAGFSDSARCKPTRPVAVLQIHGDRDAVVLYDGGAQLLDSAKLSPYAGARGPVEWWAAHNKCTPLPVREGALDFDKSVPGAELRIEAWGNCAAPVELWTVPGGQHYLPPTQAVTPAVLEFLERAAR